MPLRVWDGEVLNKEPGSTGQTKWHDDLTFTFLESRLTFNAWIALVDVPVDSGCMTYMPGSHRRPGPYRVDLSDMGGDADTYLFRHWPELEWHRRVSVPVRAGGVAFHHSRTAHAAGGNGTGNARLAFVVTYTDAEATYRPQVGFDPMDLKPGQPIPDDRYPRVSR
jgi:ectoine hydroxylase-related dioxygenase (phytanoyl-CoA dioxygenase family)